MIAHESSAAADHEAAQPHVTVRLGVIDYLNVQPVYYWLMRRGRAEGNLDGIRTVRGVPAAMNRALARGHVDISNVSSFAFGEHVHDWLLVPRLSVAAHGRVDSVLLFSWHADWRALEGGRIALSDHSATSVELVRVLCKHRYHIEPRFTTTAPNLDVMLATNDAALLIGDQALVERHAQRIVAGRGRPYVFDLATEWQTWTGLPFVFAVWAARADRAAEIRDSGVVEALRESKMQGLAQLDVIAAEYAAVLGLSRAVGVDYLRLLDYELTARDLQGLRAFLELAVPDFRWDYVRLLDD